MPFSIVEEIRHQIAIAGSVRDAITGNALIGVTVELVEEERRTLTREGGCFYFTDLSSGTYTLNIVALGAGSRYGAINGLSILVQTSPEGRPIFDLNAKVQLSPTRLAGRVVRADTNQPIPSAIVQIRRSESQTLTNREGQYILSGLQEGTPTIQASAKGFSPSIQKVTLKAGEETTANFSLTVAS